MSRNLFAIRMLLALTVVAVSLAGTPAFAQGATVVRVDPAALSAKVNDRVNLSIKVDNIANLTAIELHLSFNPGVLEVAQVTNGGFVAADFSAQNTFDNTAGTIDYAVAQINRPAAQGSGALLNIVFRAKSNGNSSVALRATQAVPSGLLLSDTNGTAIQASWVNGSVNVGGSPALTPTATQPTTTQPTATPSTATQPTATPSTATQPTATPSTATSSTATQPTATLHQSAAVVQVEPSALSAKVNDTVNLFIKVNNIANLTAIELHLSFKPGVLEVVQMTNGGFVAADFSAQNTFDNATGTIDYAVAQINRSPVQGSGVLLNIVFRAKSEGNSTVTLRATQAVQSGLFLSDPNGIAIQTSWISGSITVTPSESIHVVRFGESLYCIGRAYGVSPWAIADANGVWWPYIIFPYQRLRIPNVPWSPIPAGPVCQRQFTASAPNWDHPAPAPAHKTATPFQTTASATPVPSSVCRAIYIVYPGDTLYSIAMRYGVSYSEIARINQIPNARVIYSGQRLCIP